ncbi:MAG: hypothetical protein ACOYN6_08140 [Ignavibacteria bacterium]
MKNSFGVFKNRNPFFETPFLKKTVEKSEGISHFSHSAARWRLSAARWLLSAKPGLLSA